MFQDLPEYNGLSNIPLITTQGFKQTQCIIGIVQNKDDTGKLALGILQYKQIESGLTTIILEKQTNIDYQKWITLT